MTSTVNTSSFFPKVASLSSKGLSAAYATDESQLKKIHDGEYLLLFISPCYYNIRPNQHKAVKAFVEGNDAFLSLPTGSGKSLC